MTEEAQSRSRRSSSVASSDTLEASLKPDQTKGKRKSKPGRPGRPKLHLDEGGDVLAADLNRPSVLSGPNSTHSVNEVIPKVWIISNFSIPVMAQVAFSTLKKGDKVVIGCCPGGDNEPTLLRKADRLRQRFPDRCIVVELDVR